MNHEIIFISNDDAVLCKNVNFNSSKGIMLVTMTTLITFSNTRQREDHVILLLYRHTLLQSCLTIMYS